jgi:hypothetical protein
MQARQAERCGSKFDESGRATTVVGHRDCDCGAVGFDLQYRHTGGVGQNVVDEFGSDDLGGADGVGVLPVPQPFGH